MSSKIIIAIDGYSSSGKSSMAKELAKQIGYAYVDTGAMYRAVTLYAFQNSMISESGEIDIPLLISSPTIGTEKWQAAPPRCSTFLTAALWRGRFTAANTSAGSWLKL